MQAFRGLRDAQSYPSRTKDKIPVDLSSGSVGLGVAITAFASLVQDYLIAHGQMAQADAGRMIALMGDAELDEGNIYECLIEGYKHNNRNCWRIVDSNRQSPDSTTADRMFRRFDDAFETCGWRVLTLKHGKMQRAVFKRPGGAAIERWIDDCPNAEYAALTYQGGAAWRLRLNTDLAADKRALALVASMDNAALSALMLNRGGHCIETLVEAFAEADDERPTIFIARRLDALNYACYQDARFLLVATPTGLTPGAEGGAHESINTPLIGMGQPGLTYFEPAYADEPALLMHWAFGHMQDDFGGSVGGQPVSPLGIDRFGQTGDLPDLYRT